MNVYFGNSVTTMSTVLVLSIWVFIIFNIFKHKRVKYWGRKVTVLFTLGLLIFCFVATRDEFHLSIQSLFDETISSGLFTINSLQTILCFIGGGIIVFTSILCFFVKNQKYRKTMFFVLSCVIMLKTIIIEVSRWWI